MTPERKLAANRRNAQRSSGPRTIQGRTRSSQNAKRHGLAAVAFPNPEMAVAMCEDVRALCGDDDNPRLAEVAKTIAECDFILRAVRKEKILAITASRQRSALARTRQDMCRQHLIEWFEEVKLAVLEFESLTGASTSDDVKCESVKEAVYFEAKLSDPSPGGELAAQRLSSTEPAPKLSWRIVTVIERDEFAAMYEAMPDLMRLKRYERRAWSRRRRAILEFYRS